jgi:nucleotide-binding universal stress UspA family protein
MLFTKILFPVDFSERSHAIVPDVKAVRERFKSSLTLLHLVEVPAATYPGMEAPVMCDFPVDEMKRQATQELHRFAEASFPGLPVNIVVTEGDPGSCVAELARDWNTDLIMLPTRGRGRFRAALLGSVTAKTLHDASCAVWTEAHCEQATASHADWRSVICAIDATPEAARLIRFASQLAASSGAKIRLAHAIPTAEVGIQKYFDREFTAFLEDQARQSVAAMQKEAGTKFDLCLGAGNVPDVVRQSAENHNADLVLIGRGVLNQFAGRLRSHAYSIVLNTPCPVLSI